MKKAMVHPHYNPETNGNMVWDIAILQLTEAMDIERNPYMKIAALPPPEIRVLGRKIKVGGWGKTSGYSRGSDVHNVIQVTIHSHEVCEESFGKDRYISENMFCAGEKTVTVCEGDSGAGAMIYQDNLPIIIGVVSFGWKNKCLWESSFQNIMKSLPWIFKQTGLR